MSDVAPIILEGVGKRYLLAGDNAMLTRRVVSLLRGRRARELWALRDVDLRVARGETVGVIGRNGSGKTTLLRLLAGVSAPSVGRLRVAGSVAPLIGIGVGFNPELTGRENVLANGQMLGLSPAVLRRDFDEIVAFAELEDFVETPVKFYSSGMFLRLAFAVAIHVEPDLLLVDEVLAVGDLAFQLKCFDRMQRLQDRGTTIVVVTHNLGILERLAQRTMMLDHGQVAFVGPVDEAIDRYHELSHAEATARRRAEGGISNDALDVAGGVALSTSVSVDDDRITVDVTAEFAAAVDDPIIGAMVSEVGGGPLYMIHTLPGEYSGRHDPGKPLRARLTFDNVLLSGRYAVHISMNDAGGRQKFAQTRTPFVVERRRGAGGVVDLAAQLTLEGAPVPLAGGS